MRLMTRYILWEIIKVFTVSLVTLTAVMMVFVVVKEALRQSLTLGPILQIVPFALPFAMRYTVPATMLYSVCAVYGRMSADQEITAIKAGGVSIWDVMRPAMVLALFVSPLAIWVNDIAVSWGQPGIHQVILHSVEQIAYNRLRTAGSYSSSRFSIRVARVEDRTLIDAIINVRMQSQPPMTITAEEAELRLDSAASMLVIKLVECELEVGDKSPIGFSEHEFNVPLSAATKNGVLSTRPADLSWGRIPSELVTQRKAVLEIENRMAAQAAFQLLRGDFDGLGESQWRKPQDDLLRAKARMFKLQTERWRRTANGFSCLFFVIVGVPVAIYRRNSDLLSSFFVCFLPILGLYYPLMMLAADRAKEGALPPYCVWLGNLVFGLIGIWLIRRVVAGRPGPVIRLPRLRFA